MIEKLINIENLSYSESNDLKWRVKDALLSGKYDEVCLYCNKMTKEQFIKFMELMDYEYISNLEFISKIDDKSKFYIPFSSNILYKQDIWKNKEFSKLLISSDIFYSKISDGYHIESICSRLDKDLINYFFNNCFRYIPKAFFNFLGNSYSVAPYKEYLNDELIIESIKTVNDSNYALKFFDLLSDDVKNKVYKSDWFGKIVDLNKGINQLELIRYSTEEILNDIVSSKDVSGISLLRQFFDSRKAFYINKFIEISKDNELCSRDEFFITKNIFFITEEIYTDIKNKDRLYELINNMDDSMYIDYYFENYVTFKNQAYELKNFLFNKAKNILNNNNIEISKISTNLLKNADESLCDLVAHHVSKEDLLLLSIRYDFFNKYVMNLLSNEPDYFSNVKIINNDKFLVDNLSEEQINNYINISNFLTDEQLCIYYLPIYINNVPGIKDNYIKKLEKNSDNLSNLSDLNLMDDSNIKVILSTISISKYLDLVVYKDYKIDKDKVTLIRNIISTRFMEICDYINNSELDVEFYFDCQRIFDFIEPSNYEMFIAGISNYSFLCRTYDDTYNKNLKSALLNRLSELYDYDDNINIFTQTPAFYNKDDEYNFYDKLSFDTLLEFAINHFQYNDSNTEKYKNYMEYINKKIDTDINVLFNINIIVKLDEVISYLPEQYQNKIVSYIDNKYNTYKDKYPKLNKYINNYTDKANYIYSVENNFINENNMNRILELLEKNIYLFNSMDFRLLSEDIYKLGDYFIDKTSRYPKMADKVINICLKDANKYNLLVSLSKKMRNENNDFLYDQKMEIIINYLLKNEVNISTINDNILVNVENYILENSLFNENEFSKLNIENYIDEKNIILSNEIESCNDINKLKDLVFKKYFGLNTIEINKFLFEYASNYYLVSNYSENDFPNKYINLINTVISFSDVELLKNYIKTMPIFNISSNLVMKSIMIDAYNKCISDELHNNYALDDNKKININGIEFSDYTDKFGLFVHSTDAYGSMPLINNDYYDSWNYNPNTRNHGICTSFISNSNYGTAAVHGNGVMFGFNKNDDNSITLMAPYDLATKNEGYTIRSFHKAHFTNLKGMSDYTRHTHNEATIERRVFKDNKFTLKQPDCIIIFEDMDDLVKQNSIKAYNDFKKHGIDLELIYIDRVKNSKREAEKLSLLLDEYEETYNLDILSEILNVYESNICSCDYIGTGKQESINLFNQHELFMTHRVNTILYSTIAYLKECNDISLIDKFKYILDNEQSKFDMLNDFNKNRSHKFTLYDSNIKEEINKLYNDYEKEKTF